MLVKLCVVAIFATAYISPTTAVTDEEFQTVLDRLAAVENRLETSLANGKHFY